MGNHSEHLYNDMDLMAIGQPVLQPSNGYKSWRLETFVQIPTMKSSRKSSNAVKLAKHHVRHPSQILDDAKSLPPKSDRSVKPLSLQRPMASSQFQAEKVMSMPSGLYKMAQMNSREHYSNLTSSGHTLDRFVLDMGMDTINQHERKQKKIPRKPRWR